MNEDNTKKIVFVPDKREKKMLQNCSLRVITFLESFPKHERLWILNAVYSFFVLEDKIDSVQIILKEDDGE